MLKEAKQHGEASFCWAPGKASPAGIFAKEGSNVQHYCSLRDLMVMARDEFASDNTENKTGTSEEAEATTSKGLAEAHGAGGKAAKQPCARWAGIAKKGRCKRPAPPAMGGAEKYPRLKSIQD